MSKEKEVIELVSKDGVIATYKNKQDAYRMLGYNFIINNVGFEIKKINYNSPLSRYFLTDANNRLKNQWMRDGIKKYGEAMRELKSYGDINYYGQYMLINEYGEKLCIVDFSRIIIEERKIQDEKRSVRYNQKFWNGEGAVPGTGKKTYGNYFRHPKTLAALREACEIKRDEDEIFVPVRGRRRKGYVPSSWDDIHRSDIGVKCWKRHRKTQYKTS